MWRPMVIACAALAVASCRGKGEAEEPEEPAASEPSAGMIENRVPEPEPEPEPDPEPEPEPEVDPDATTAAATQPSQGPLAAQVNLNQLMTGVPDCDQFLREYLGCAAMLPEETQRPMVQAVLQMKDAWQQASGTQDGRNALAQACQQALVAARQSYQSLGCAASP